MKNGKENLKKSLMKDWRSKTLKVSSLKKKKKCLFVFDVEEHQLLCSVLGEVMVEVMANFEDDSFQEVVLLFDQEYKLQILVRNWEKEKWEGYLLLKKKKDFLQQQQFFQKDSRQHLNLLFHQDVLTLKSLPETQLKNEEVFS